MKFKSIITSILATAILVNADSVQADFNSALDDYAAKNYKAAFGEFMSMAKLGEKRSQFNLGVMYFHGQGVKQDKYSAFAWIKLATESETLDQNEKQIFDLVKKSIDDQDKASKIYQELSQKYSSSVLLSTLYPQFVKPENAASFDAEPVKIKQPQYPKKAFRKNHQGWVRFGFDTDKKGTPRNIVVKESFPEGVFTREALKAVQKWQFKPALDENGEPRYRKGLRYTIEFRLGNSNGVSIKKDVYEKTLKSAQDGDANAQFKLAFWQMKLPSMRNENNPNEWFLKAAKQGHSHAQYYVGRNLIRGEGCLEDKVKGVEWLTRAATSGDPKAKQMLARVSLEQETKESHVRAKSLLTEVQNLGTSSVLEYAWLLIKSPYSEVADADEALKLIKKLDSSNFRDEATLYEIRAAAYAAKGNFEKAVDLQKEAIDEAEDLRADTELLEANLRQYQSKKVWF